MNIVAEIAKAINTGKKNGVPPSVTFVPIFAGLRNAGPRAIGAIGISELKDIAQSTGEAPYAIRRAFDSAKLITSDSSIVVFPQTEADVFKKAMKAAELSVITFDDLDAKTSLFQSIDTEFSNPPAIVHQRRS